MLECVNIEKMSLMYRSNISVEIIWYLRDGTPDEIDIGLEK